MRITKLTKQKRIESILWLFNIGFNHTFIAGQLGISVNQVGHTIRRELGIKHTRPYRQLARIKVVHLLTAFGLPERAIASYLRMAPCTVNRLKKASSEGFTDTAVLIEITKPFLSEAGKLYDAGFFKASPLSGNRACLKNAKDECSVDCFSLVGKVKLAPEGLY